MITRIGLFLALYFQSKPRIVALIQPKVADNLFMDRAYKLSTKYGVSLFKIVLGGARTGLDEVERQPKNRPVRAAEVVAQAALPVLLRRAHPC